MSTYPAGTVAIATVKGVKDVRVFRYAEAWGSLNWVSATSVGSSTHIVHSDRAVTDIRPLVVLDLASMYSGTDMGGWEYVVTALREGPARVTREDIADQIEAQTKPPRIPEPGLWGVVEATAEVLDGNRHNFARHTGGWFCPGLRPLRWSDLIDPTLIRKGIES